MALYEKMLSELFLRYPKLNSQSENIRAAFESIIKCYESEGKLLVCGNGGSASDAEHIVGEMMKGFMNPRELTEEQKLSLSSACKETGEYLAKNLQRGLPAISLVSQTSLITAYSNDMQPDMIFAQQVFSYGKPLDLLLGITTSGTSTNIINAIKVAKAVGMSSILLTGNKNNKYFGLADVTIHVDEIETYKIQELHLPIYHTLCAAVEAYFFS